MLLWRKRIKKMIYIMMDVVTILWGIIISNQLYSHFWGKSLNMSQLEYFGLLSIILVVIILLSLMTRLYINTIEANGNLTIKIIVKMMIAYVTSTIWIGASLFYMKVVVPRSYIMLIMSVMVVLVLVNRLILKVLLFKGDSASEAVRNILVVGQSDRGGQYIEEIHKHAYLNLNILGYVSIRRPDTYIENYKLIEHLGTLETLSELAEAMVVDEIVVAKPLSYDKCIKPILNNCQSMGITITMILDTQNTDTAKAQVAMIGQLPVLKFHTVSLNETQIYAKRMLDVLGAIVGMILFGVAYIIVGPLIKLESPGPVIFKQDRVGKNGRIFKVWKFRSMGINAETQKAKLLDNNEMQGHMFKMTHDPRITRIGGFIRKTSIDELPQFYNVLKGDMSLVGTRPPTVDEVQAYEQHHRRRISITPGITGNWQVSGRSDIEDFEEIVKLDSEYIENWSLWTDIRILLKTVHVVVFRKGSR